MNHQHRPSFTLVELLISIAIIGVMAGMVLYTLAGAQQDALRNKTKVTLDKINAVVLERWEGYRYRSVKLEPRILAALRNKQIRARDVAEMRSLFLKDMMRMEMPDCYNDLLYSPTSWEPVPFKSLPGREYNILRQYFGMVLVPDGATPDFAFPDLDPRFPPPPEPWELHHAEAECLYAIVAHSTSGGGSALEAFGPSEIGDLDGDGFPEFIDAWGTPISWIRWPAGFTSALNDSYKTSVPQVDAFDPLRTAAEWNDVTVIQKPWTVVPLIVSAGPDRVLGILLNQNRFATSKTIFTPNTANPTVGEIDPPLSLNHVDNVSNHDLLLE